MLSRSGGGPGATTYPAHAATASTYATDRRSLRSEVFRRVSSRSTARWDPSVGATVLATSAETSEWRRRRSGGGTRHGRSRARTPSSLGVILRPCRSGGRPVRVAPSAVSNLQDSPSSRGSQPTEAPALTAQLAEAARRMRERFFRQGVGERRPAARAGARRACLVLESWVSPEGGAVDAGRLGGDGPHGEGRTTTRELGTAPCGEIFRIPNTGGTDGLPVRVGALGVVAVREAGATPGRGPVPGRR